VPTAAELCQSARNNIIAMKQYEPSSSNYSLVIVKYGFYGLGISLIIEGF
jgi:hypothetical protein